MQKKKIISTYLSLANYVADTIAIETKKSYKKLNIKSYKKLSAHQVVTNLDLKIEITPPSILRQGKANGKYDFFRASWIADYPNPENYFGLFYSKNKTPNGPNYTYFMNERYDSIYNILNDEESHIEKNFEILENIIHNFSPIIPLYYDMSIRLLDSNIVGMSNNAINMLDLEKINKL